MKACFLRLDASTNHYRYGVPASLFLAATFFASLTLAAFLAGALAAVFVGVFLIGMNIYCHNDF